MSFMLRKGEGSITLYKLVMVILDSSSVQTVPSTTDWIRWWLVGEYNNGCCIVQHSRYQGIDNAMSSAVTSARLLAGTNSSRCSTKPRELEFASCRYAWLSVQDQPVFSLCKLQMQFRVLWKALIHSCATSSMNAWPKSELLHFPPFGTWPYMQMDVSDGMFGCHVKFYEQRFSARHLRSCFRTRARNMTFNACTIGTCMYMHIQLNKRKPFMRWYWSTNQDFF